nr:MAG TPA: putative periplasmic lipoprotein [Caudoviricetes sp.]
MKKFLDCVYRIFGKLATIGSDKYLHMFAGLVVSMIACKALHAIDAYLIFALVPAFFAMIGKESVDHYYRKEQFDWLDVCAGMLGAIVGVFLFLL